MKPKQSGTKWDLSEIVLDSSIPADLDIDNDTVYLDICFYRAGTDPTPVRGRYNGFCARIPLGDGRFRPDLALWREDEHVFALFEATGVDIDALVTRGEELWEAHEAEFCCS